MKLFAILFIAVFCFLPFIHGQPAIEEIRYSTFNAVQISNEDAVAVAALKDKNIPPEHVRYLSLHNFPEARREEIKAAVDLSLNSLNPRYRSLVQTVGLPANAPAPVVLRVNLKDYGIDPKAWDRLAETGSGPNPIPDPYFHTFITQDTQVIDELVEWVPVLDVIYTEGTVGQCVINVTALGDYAISFDGGKYSKADRATQTYTIGDVASGQTVAYTVGVKGAFGHTKYDVSKQISMTSGGVCNITLNKPTSKHKTRKGTGKEYASAPWIALEPQQADRGKTIANLISTTQTSNPILRADWFIVYAMWAPAYYDLIGLPLRDNPDKEDAKKRPKVYLEKDFEKLMNADKKTAEKDIIATVTDTRVVALHNRILQRFNTVTGLTGGYYWQSTDTDNGIDAEDYVNQVTNYKKPVFAATEIIASGRNGLNFYFIADNKGIGLNLAAAAVAQHSDAMPCKYQDKQVFAARNCQLCHATGLIPLKDKIRSIAQDKIVLLLTQRGLNEDEIKAFNEAFQPATQEVLDVDNAKFTAAVKVACGKEAALIAKVQETITWEYWDKSVKSERMARDAGLSQDKMLAMLKEGINIDYTLTAVLANPEEPVATLTWERQGFAALMNYLISYQAKK